MKDTNKFFAEHDEVFKKACEIAGVDPTPRQASKYRMKRGSAYKWKKVAITELKKDLAETNK